MLLVLAGLLLLDQDMVEVERIGHTRVYWPLLLAFALLARCEAWTAACVVLGSLAVARTTMVSLFPVLLLYLWHRHQLTRTRVALMFGSACVMALRNRRPLGVARPGPGWTDLTFEALARRGSTVSTCSSSGSRRARGGRVRARAYGRCQRASISSE